MATFFTALIASVVGQLISLYIVGMMAQRAERKNKLILEGALKEHHELLLKEQQKMVDYVRMES